ncbi:MAG: glycosyltransferase [Myxococcaceae bacterium]|nr:glycosyltransferase [Myxococcaceae bacterium]
MSLHSAVPPRFLHDALQNTSPTRHWLRHLGMLNDYVRIPYANGSSFASQFLYREFRALGHEVTVVGPDDPEANAADLPDRYVMLRALPLLNHPGVRMPMPSARALSRVAAQRFDLVLGQTGSELAELGVWLRATQHVPFVCVNTLHLRTAYNVVLPDVLAENKGVTDWFDAHIVPTLERHAAQVYNRSDGLVVLCSGLARFWRERGVTAPIHVVPRSVDPKIFESARPSDPFLELERGTRGERLLVVCRHTREKSVDRLLHVFAERIAKARPRATLTLVGDGPEHDHLKALAARLGVADRTFFPGEFPVTEMVRFYRHADLFLYASLSETYGQVVSEALWAGLPVVAFADDMGVSDQLEHGVTGLLVRPGPDPIAADAELAAHALRLLEQPQERRALSAAARERTRARVHPRRVIASYYEVFEQARAHCLRTVEDRIDSPLAPLAALGRWAAVQSAAVGLGCLRRPALINRHGRKQPGWGALEV